MEHDKNEFKGYFQKYADLVDGKDLSENFAHSISLFLDNLGNVPPEKYLYKYQDDKWTIKEMLSHLIDTERVFAYRALAISRGEKVINSFDQDVYVKNAGANLIKWDLLCNDLIYTRANTKSMFALFSEDHLKMKAEVGGNELSVLTLAYIINGHMIHHNNILQKLYLE